MAKGPDSEEIMLMSESEIESGSGFKRDYSSLFTNQADSGKFNGILGYSRKRFRKCSGSNMESKNKIEEESSSFPPQEECGNGVMEIQNGLASPVTITEEETKSNAEKVMPEEVMSRRVTRSGMKFDGGNSNKEVRSVGENDFRDLVVCLRSPNANEETSRVMVSSTVKPTKSCAERTTRNFETEPLAMNVDSIPHELSLEKMSKKFADSELEVPVVNSDSFDADVVVSPREFVALDLEHETPVELLNDSKKLQKGCKTAEKDSSCDREVRTTIVTTIVAGDGKENSETKPRLRFTRSALSSAAQTEIVDEEMHYESAIEPRLRFTRSALSSPAKTGIVDVSSEVQKMLASTSEEVLIDDDESLLGTSSDKSTSVVKIEHMMVDSNREAHDAATIKPKRFPRIAMECMTEPRGINANSKVYNTILDTPGRRFTRSALVCEKEVHAMDEVKNVQITSPERPLRRFTRSTLNVKDEPIEMLDASISSGDDTLLEKFQQNKHSENCLSRTTNVVSQIRTPAHKKLEMKMSKKIALKRLPGKISELLETGMLEGLSVTYVSRAQQNEVLKGTIKESGILCSCTVCKGRKVVTATEFERHAGSRNKNPAHHIYMDNGNSLHDVLSACKDAPLNILEATIQMAIKAPAIKNALCLNCKRPTGTRTLLLCNSCLELNRSQTSPAGTTRRSKQSSNPKESVDTSKHISPQSKSTRGKLTRKDLRLHKLVFEEHGLPDGTELAYYMQGQKLLEGYKKGHGIFCFCCNSEISASQFEAHAGFATRRKPYLNIYTSNGVSLHELSISLSKGRKLSAKDNDDLCGICADFGDLLLCDGCPRAFHKDCIGEASVPRGKWYCPYCQEMFEKDQACAHNANAVAAGRISGVDPIEEISKRCIRIVKTSENEFGGCTLCRLPGFSKSGFGPRTIILCDQCEKEFHVGCLKEHKIADLKVLPKGKWFCSNDCSRISNVLDKCVLRGPEELPPSITKSIKTVQKEEELKISWRLLSGKVASPESRSLLSKAVAIFHNRFDPIVDMVTGRDLIPCMVYGRSIRNQEFGGMFCAVLTVNSCVVSAGLVRVLGQEMAEIPLVATSSDHQGRGYFQSLFSCIERLMGFLKVKNLVLPAAEEAEAIWTEKFGFRKLSQEQTNKYKKDYQMTVFRETPVLYKPVRKCRIVKPPAENTS